MLTAVKALPPRSISMRRPISGISTRARALAAKN
jgi:hypothetical protein